MDRQATRNARAPTSPRSIGFCAIWESISSSSMCPCQIFEATPPGAAPGPPDKKLGPVFVASGGVIKDTSAESRPPYLRPASSARRGSLSARISPCFNLQYRHGSQGSSLRWSWRFLHGCSRSSLWPDGTGRCANMRLPPPTRIFACRPLLPLPLSSTGCDRPTVP